MTIVIKEPGIEDVRGIQDVYYETWLHTYPNKEYGITKEVIEESYKDRHAPEVLEARRERIRHPKENEYFLIACDGNKVVGVCRVIKNPDHNRLLTMYVLPRYQGKGIGTALWKKAKGFLDLSRDTLVDVATYNTKTISFYEKLGFVDTGKRFTEEHVKSGIHFPEMEMILKKTTSAG